MRRVIGPSGSPPVPTSPYGPGMPADDRESAPLPLGAEFDGVHRKLAAPEPLMLEPSHYGELHGGTD